jgi:2-hydroxychromene-2-carboxylate isomerase
VSAAAPVAIQYWLSTSNPRTWLGSGHFMQLARRARARVEVLPVDLGAVFAATGGLPVAQRPPARHSYRLLELTRWSRRLRLPLVIESARAPATGELENTRRAIAAEVFGSPTRVVAGERFRGQDRLDLLAEHILGA